jgi:hypothetical protein
MDSEAKSAVGTFTNLAKAAVPNILNLLKAKGTRRKGSFPDNLP